MTIPLDSDLMRTFLEVAETGSVTRAADAVGRTQSAVSMQIRRLEAALGQVLFERLPRGVTLTEQGTRLIPYARRAIRSLDEAALAMRNRAVAGPVRIGFPPDYSDTVLPAILARFADLHPEAEVGVRCDYSEPQLAALGRGELDIAIVFDRPEPDQGEVLRVERTVWVTSDTHAQHFKRPLPISTYFNSRWCQEHMIGSLQLHGIDYRVAFECDTTHGFLSAVRSGLAVVALARSVIPDGCRELTEHDGFPAVDLSSLVMRRAPGGTPVVDALAEVVAQTFRKGQL